MDEKRPIVEHVNPAGGIFCIYCPDQVSCQEVARCELSHPEPRPDPVKCESCVYFRAFTEDERKDSVGRVSGDGWCLADPPKIGARQVSPSYVIVEPVHPPTYKDRRCRHWRAEFAGDAGMPVAEALESLAEDMTQLVMYIRESINVGRGKGR